MKYNSQFTGDSSWLPSTCASGMHLRPIKVSLGKRHIESLFLSGLACLASGCDLFFSFSNFFDKLARKSLLSRLSRDSLVSFPTDCGGMIENLGTRGAISLIPSKALYQNQHYVIPRIFGLNVIHICTNSWPIFMPDFLFFFLLLFVDWYISL